MVTYETKINSLIKVKSYKIPFVNSIFAGSKSISRITNGQQRPRTLWTEANRKEEEQITLRLLSWTGKLLGWHIDHIDPVCKGGSYNVRNLRLLPPQLNSFISGSGNWPHEKLNRLLEHLGPEWRAEFGIPEGFKSCTPEELFKSLDLITGSSLESGT
jgi:hypothetical protein